MKQESEFQIVDYDKFPELVKLWNAWWRATCFLSTGNCEVQEWKDLVAYGKEHIEEVAEFIYDMFENNIEVGWPQMSLYDKCLGKPLVYTKDGGYINPAWEPVQNAYKLACGLHCRRIKTYAIEETQIEDQKIN